MISQAMNEPRYRAVAVSALASSVTSDADGVFRLRCSEPLAPWPDRLLDRLVLGAMRHPDRVLVAKRTAAGPWCHLTYAEMFERARRIGQWLLDRHVSPERPLMILSGNDLEHLQMAFGAMYAGIPYCPLSPAYSAHAQRSHRLRDAIDAITPGVVFAADAGAFASAIALTADRAEVVTHTGEIPGHPTIPFEALLETEPSSVDTCFRETGPDTIAKLLFTSGSEGRVKAVITTQRMLCSNQQMILQTFPVLGEEPPVLVDWLPWHHTFGGSHNVGIVLYNGGTLYIDDGRPMDAHFGETLRNLREIAPTAYFNVPKGWEDLAAALEQDAILRQTFLSRVKFFLCAGASPSQATWDRLDRVIEGHTGERIRMLSGLGMTETSPSVFFTPGGARTFAGYVGLPVPGCEVKLVPCGDKCEARVRGPNVMPGYFRPPPGASPPFDEEGFYKTGDALAWLDEAQPERGLLFNGRIGDDFKLSSGVFVNVGAMRSRAIAAGAPFVFDVAVTGHGRGAVGLLIFPGFDACRALAGLDRDATPAAILTAPAVRSRFQTLVNELSPPGSGTSCRVERAMVLAEPPSFERGEITDKRSLNQKAVLFCRAADVERMYADPDAPVIFPKTRKES